MSANQAGSNNSDRRSRIIRRTISVVSGCFVCAIGTALFWTNIRVAAKPVPDDLSWFWGALIAAGIFLLVALFVYFVAQRTLWDLLGLLVVPLALAAIGLWFSAQQDTRQQQLEEQRAQNAALQAYLDQMSQLMLERDLRGSKEGSKVRILARARTQTVLGQLDSDRKASVVQFLYEASLIEKGQPVLKLSHVGLRDANLSQLQTLSRADLTGADLRRADLHGTDLSDAILHGADLRGANLRDANLGGAEMINALLNSANLSGAEMNYARLNGADLSGANLSGALLRYARLREAKLIETDLSGADLRGANLRDAILSDPDLHKLKEQAKTLKGATMPSGSIHH